MILMEKEIYETLHLMVFSSNEEVSDFAVFLVYEMMRKNLEELGFFEVLLEELLQKTETDACFLLIALDTFESYFFI